MHRHIVSGRIHYVQYMDDIIILAKTRGIHVVELSFIPEKYRLDVKRAEKILNGSLREWLKTVEAGDQ